MLTTAAPADLAGGLLVVIPAQLILIRPTRNPWSWCLPTSRRIASWVLVHRRQCKQLLPKRRHMFYLKRPACSLCKLAFVSILNRTSEATLSYSAHLQRRLAALRQKSHGNITMNHGGSKGKITVIFIDISIDREYNCCRASNTMKYYSGASVSSCRPWLLDAFKRLGVWA
jgi:hypothetical protein